MLLIPSRTLLFLFLCAWTTTTSTALFCNDWCVEPYCRCHGHGWIQFHACHDYFSGHHCQCPFSRTNIADDSYLLVPNSRKGSLTLSKAADGNLLAGTWLGAFEYDHPTTTAVDSNSIEFDAWLPKNSVENVWSMAKTKDGTQFIGTPDGVMVRRTLESSFRHVLDNGVQGDFAVLGNRIFVGTLDGLYMSENDGESWTKAPADCTTYQDDEDEDDSSSNGSSGETPVDSGAKPPLVPKPPAESKYCDAPVKELLVVNETTLIAFYMGYGGAHLIHLLGDIDPLLPENWQPLPTFQDDATCRGGFCHVLDATMYNDRFLYVAFQSLPMARLDMTATNPQAWEAVSLEKEDTSSNTQVTVTAVTTVGTQLFAATNNGLYQSNDGSTWQLVSDDACRGERNKPPLMSLGMEHVQDNDGADLLVFGTVLGPWVYRIAP